MYKLTNTDAIIRLADGATIPKEPRNRDYKKYLMWEEAGGVPEPADVVEPVYSITPDYKIVPQQDPTGGKPVYIAITGAPGDYTIIVEGIATPEQSITIDETGIEIIELPAIDAGVYVIKGTGLLSQCVSRVEVI